MQSVSVIDIARRFEQNPLLTPGQIKPSNEEMKVECLLNPGVFRFEKKIWLLLRVAERPEQTEGYVTVAFYNDSGDLETKRFAKNDPHLDVSDPRVVRYKGDEYLTTLSHLKLMCS